MNIKEENVIIFMVNTISIIKFPFSLVFVLFTITYLKYV